MSEQDKHEGDDGRATVAEYVLGLLDASAHEAVGRRIADDPQLQREHDFWASHFAGLDEQFEPVAPPAYILPRIETRLFGEEKRTSWWDSLALWRSVAAGALAVAAVAVGFSVLQPRPDSSALADQLVAALRAEGSDVQFLALYDGSGAVRLTALSGEALPNNDYELWAIQGGGSPISMGVVPINARSTVELSDAVRAGWGEGSVLAITLEPKGGAPAGVPTGPVVAQGAVTKI
ncbi:anti-sigma factor [Devosia sp.]|uniref:anti-sigma factor n=1 Tax=Devosia sp. TaxID=1871048 RepID=UPI0025EE0B9E|nr:anti-sigma factor [Devosia sp.]MCR6636730.1 anti-sigma factor [Devosia sp.]